MTRMKRFLQVGAEEQGAFNVNNDNGRRSLSIERGPGTALRPYKLEVTELSHRPQEAGAAMRSYSDWETWDLNPEPWQAGSPACTLPHTPTLPPPGGRGRCRLNVDVGKEASPLPETGMVGRVSCVCVEGVSERMGPRGGERGLQDSLGTLWTRHGAARPSGDRKWTVCRDCVDRELE